MNTEFIKLGLRGISILVASGDTVRSRQRTTCGVQHATCNMQHTSIVQDATCSIHPSCNMQHAACIHRATCNMRHTSIVQHVRCSIRHRTCNMALSRSCNSGEGMEAMHCIPVPWRPMRPSLSGGKVTLRSSFSLGLCTALHTALLYCTALRHSPDEPSLRLPAQRGLWSILLRHVVPCCTGLVFPP
jgi:hypothetical protein